MALAPHGGRLGESSIRANRQGHGVLQDWALELGGRPVFAIEGVGTSMSGAWLYDLYRNWGSMGEIAVSQARENLAEVIESAQRSGEPIVLTRHGRPVAVVLDHAAFERLVAAADEASDRAALVQAREDDDSVPWEQVKVDLGLV